MHRSSGWPLWWQHQWVILTPALCGPLPCPLHCKTWPSPDYTTACGLALWPKSGLENPSPSSQSSPKPALPAAAEGCVAAWPQYPTVGVAAACLVLWQCRLQVPATEPSAVPRDRAWMENHAPPASELIHSAALCLTERHFEAKGARIMWLAPHYQLMAEPGTKSGFSDRHLIRCLCSLPSHSSTRARLFCSLWPDTSISAGASRIYLHQQKLISSLL